MLFQLHPGFHDIGQDIKTKGQVLTHVKIQISKLHSSQQQQTADTQMSNASKGFGGLKKRVWLNKDLSIKTKCAVYRAIFLSTILYGAETWTIYKADAQRLPVFTMRHFYKMLNVATYPEYIAQHNLRWASYLNRFEDSRLRKQIQYSQLWEGHAKQRDLKLRPRDIIKRKLRITNIPLDNCLYLSKNRKNWKKKIAGCHHKIKWIASSSSSSSS